MTRFIEFIDRLNSWTGRAIAWLTLFMVLVTFLVVVLRYAFSTGWIAMQESVTYMHAMVFMLGAAATMKQDGHVRVDIFYQRMSQKGRALVDMLGGLLLLIPFMLYMLASSWEYVSSSWSLLEGSREAGGLPAVFLLKSLIPAMAILLMLQGIAGILRSLLTLLDKDGAS